jgi:hypothetical protein
MRLMGFVVVLAVNLTLAPLAIGAQASIKRTHTGINPYG